MFSRHFPRQSLLVPVGGCCIFLRSLSTGELLSGIETDCVLDKVRILEMGRADLVRLMPKTERPEHSGWLKPPGRTTGKLYRSNRKLMAMELVMSGFVAVDNLSAS